MASLSASRGKTKSRPRGGCCSSENGEPFGVDLEMKTQKLTSRGNSSPKIGEPFGVTLEMRAAGRTRDDRDGPETIDGPENVACAREGKRCSKGSKPLLKSMKTEGRDDDDPSNPK